MAPAPAATRADVYAFTTDELATRVPITADLDVTTPAVASDVPTAAATDATQRIEAVALPPIDRIFEYDRHFRVDEPFAIRLKRGETVLLPLEPLHDQLFESPVPLAIGLELSNCVGSVQSFVALKSDVAQRISTASYQCVTLTHTRAAQQERVNLCPHYDPAFPAAMRVDPALVKGFVLRADVDTDVESIALLRSTKASGGFAATFVVSSDAEPSRMPLNVSFSDLAAAPDARDAPPSSHATTCKSCEYVLLAEKLAPNHMSAMASSPEQLALPYCVWHRASVQYPLPALAQFAADAPTHHAVKLDDVFADRFQSSGEYRFVLLASLPRDANHHHAAMIAYAPQQLTVAVRPFYQSRFFLAFVAVALVGVAAIVFVKHRLHRRVARAWRKATAAASSSPSSDTEDASEVMSLLARSSSAPPSPRGASMDALEQRLLADCLSDSGGEEEEDTARFDRRTSLLEAIKQTKEQPRGVQQLDGYHEIL